MRTPKDESRRIVYSTDRGRLCYHCSRPIAECVCEHNNAVSAGDGIVRIRRETKGRRGKGVTVITGVPLERSKLSQLGKQLKRRCGTGGTVKNGVIEIQGDHRDVLVEELQKRGWTVKRSGG